MELAKQAKDNFDPLEALARAELDRVARDLSEQREPVHRVAPANSLGVVVAAQDAQLWAAINSRGSARE